MLQAGPVPLAGRNKSWTEEEPAFTEAPTVSHDLLVASEPFLGLSLSENQSDAPSLSEEPAFSEVRLEQECDPLHHPP